jgi:NAD(P)-dependent dehydrogenase (short-subunit alcohol dehydrogenase family)
MRRRRRPIRPMKWLAPPCRAKVRDSLDRAVLEGHLAVNRFGPYGVTQTFLPLLARSRGAIVNVLYDCRVRWTR